MRVDGSRTDAAENRRRLVDAVGRLLARTGSVVLTDLAAEAGVSRSTTYRNFSTGDEAISAYLDEFLAQFEAATSAADSLRHISEVWADLVEQRSPALIHVRSTEGFLARVRQGDPVIMRIDRVVRRAIVGDDAFTLTAADVDMGVFLWNSLLDPRELLDLAWHTGASVPEAAATMIDHVLAALERMSS